MKDIQTGKIEIKLSLFAYDVIAYVDNLKDFTKKLELLSEFSKVVGFMSNT